MSYAPCEDTVVDRRGVRGPHPWIARAWAAGRGEHAGRPRRAAAPVRRADVRLPRERSVEGCDGPDLHRRWRIRRTLRPAGTVFTGLPRPPGVSTVVGRRAPRHDR